MGEFEDESFLLDELEWAASVIQEAVCWRCMEVPVESAGDECVECPPPVVPPQLRGLQRGPQSANHPNAAYDPAVRPDASEMTAEEREAELRHLIDTQGRGGLREIPRETEWRKRVILTGDEPRRSASQKGLGTYVRGRLERP